jgi:hypothetical protein
MDKNPTLTQCAQVKKSVSVPPHAKWFFWHSLNLGRGKRSEYRVETLGQKRKSLIAVEAKEKMVCFV